MAAKTMPQSSRQKCGPRVPGQDDNRVPPKFSQEARASGKVVNPHQVQLEIDRGNVAVGGIHLGVVVDPQGLLKSGLIRPAEMYHPCAQIQHVDRISDQGLRHQRITVIRVGRPQGAITHHDGASQPSSQKQS